MRMPVLAALLAFAAPSFAQHAPGYAVGEREIKALSAAEIKQYRSGEGMAFALAAELNRYPGPAHALELADELKLTTEQHAALKSLMGAHKAEARALGARLVDAERELDGLFRSGTVTAPELRARVHAAGELRSEYRLAHLDTHRRTRELLTSAQVALYDQLRGYAPDSQEHRHGTHK